MTQIDGRVVAGRPVAATRPARPETPSRQYQLHCTTRSVRNRDQEHEPVAASPPLTEKHHRAGPAEHPAHSPALTCRICLSRSASSSCQRMCARLSGTRSAATTGKSPSPILQGSSSGGDAMEAKLPEERRQNFFDQLVL